MTTERSVPAITTEIRQHYVGLIDALNRAGKSDLASQCAQLAVGQGAWADPLQRPVEYVPGASSRPVYDAADFWFVHHLEANFEKILAEVTAITDPAGQGFAPVTEPLVGSGRWDQVVLYESGRRNESACRLFPLVAEVIEQIPEATTHGPGVVTLSWLDPGSHIIPHCGRTNAQLRVHLGLQVPDQTAIRVGTEQLSWQEGRCIVFDDSFEHEVWHHGSRPRIVLILDVLYPGLEERQRERILSRRRTVPDQIASYLAAHGLRRVELDERGAILRPSPEAEALVRQYLAEAGATAVELADGAVIFER